MRIQWVPVNSLLFIDGIFSGNNRLQNLFSKLQIHSFQIEDEMVYGSDDWKKFLKKKDSFQTEGFVFVCQNPNGEFLGSNARHLLGVFGIS